MEGRTQLISGIKELTARATLWRWNNGDVALRVTGDAEELLRRHVNEAVEVAILDKTERVIAMFNSSLRFYKSNGHDYLVVFYPRKLTPMLPIIEQSKDSDGKIWIVLRLLGVKKPSRRIKEGRRGGLG
jgi:hypothetical protein